MIAAVSFATWATLNPLANHLWQSTLCAALVGLLTLLLRGERAHVRHSLWLIAAVKFLVPFSILIGTVSRLGTHSPAAGLHSSLSIAAQAITAPFDLPVVPPAGPRFASQAAAGNPLPSILLAIWLSGCVAVLCCWWIRWRRITAAVNPAVPLRDGREFEALRRFRSNTGIETRINLVSSQALQGPGVLGIWRPVLLLPVGISNHLADEQLEAIIAHELCHARRRDNLASAIQMVVEAAFWFYPLVWWMGARLIDEQERTCDEEVLRLGCKPPVYAESILRVCKFYLESPMVYVAGVTGSNLKKRMERIMNHRIPKQLGLAKKLLIASAAILAMAGPMVIGWMNPPRSRAQSGGAAAVPPPQFEVASVKRNAACGARRGGALPPSPGRINLECQTLLGLMMTAYGVFANGATISPKIPEITGGPGWVTSDPYDVAAKAEGNAPFPQMAGPMLRALLEERFKLRVHRETKEVPVYFLTAAKNGPKLEATKEGSCVPIDPKHPPAPIATPGQPRPNYCGATKFQRRGSTMVLTLHGATMEQLTAVFLSRIVDRPVIDKTGIAGQYDFQIEFEYTPDSGRAGDPGAPEPPAFSDMPSIFGVLQAKLGLKLEPGKGPSEILVIDHVERPTEN